MIFMTQGKLLDIIDNKSEGSIQIIIDSASIYNSTDKETYISHIEIKTQRMDKTFTVNKLEEWKREGTVLAFIFPETGSNPICVYDGNDYHPITQQRTIPLSFFKNKFFKGYENVIKWSGYGFILAALCALVIHQPLSVYQITKFITSFTLLFGGLGLIYTINNFLNFWEMKKRIREDFNPKIFNNHKTSKFIGDILHRRFIFKKGKTIENNDIVKAINTSDLNHTQKLQLQNKLPSNEKISYKDLLKIQKEYFNQIKSK